MKGKKKNVRYKKRNIRTNSQNYRKCKIKKEIYTYIEVPKDTKNGDYAFPCFRLAKTLRKSPPEIANQIKEKARRKMEYQIQK